jgi:hypothetical protein
MTTSVLIAASYKGINEGRSANGYLEYTLTTDHASSSYGAPVLVSPDGTAYGAMDTLPNGEAAWWEVSGANWHDSTEAEKSLRDKFVALSRTA